MCKYTIVEKSGGRMLNIRVRTFCIILQAICEFENYLPPNCSLESCSVCVLYI